MKKRVDLEEPKYRFWRKFKLLFSRYKRHHKKNVAYINLNEVYNEAKPSDERILEQALNAYKQNPKHKKSIKKRVIKKRVTKKVAKKRVPVKRKSTRLKKVTKKKATRKRVVKKRVRKAPPKRSKKKVSKKRK